MDSMDWFATEHQANQAKAQLRQTEEGLRQVEDGSGLMWHKHSLQLRLLVRRSVLHVKVFLKQRSHFA